jgi:hypothetical protein
MPSGTTEGVTPLELGVGRGEDNGAAEELEVLTAKYTESDEDEEAQEAIDYILRHSQLEKFIMT